MLGNIGGESVNVPEAPAATPTADVSPDNIGDAIAECVRKRCKTHKSTKSVSPQPGPSSAPRHSHIAEVVMPAIHPCPKVAALPPPVGPPPAAPRSGHPSPSTSFSPVNYSSSFSLGSHLSPPSTIGTSRLVPDLSSHLRVVATTLF